jgi:hypothetical protein
LLINNDWSKDKNGENYRQRISESDRSRDIGKFIDSTSNQINKVNEKYKKRWSERQVDPKRSFQLTPEQKEYFKDTKVVDEKGNPKVVYHGTIGTFDKFHPISYFTSDPEYASDVAMQFSQEGGENVKPVYLNIKNPKRYTTEDEFENFVMSGPSMGRNLDKLIQQGYDGIIYEPEGGYGSDEIIAFKPEQIKSVYNQDPKSTGRSFSLEPTYFSTATRAVDKLGQKYPQKSLKARGIKNFLKREGATKEELEFLNIDAFLKVYKPTESIPIQDIKNFVKSNEIKITEVERGVYTDKPKITEYNSIKSLKKDYPNLNLENFEDEAEINEETLEWVIGDKFEVVEYKNGDKWVVMQYVGQYRAYKMQEGIMEEFTPDAVSMQEARGHIRSIGKNVAKFSRFIQPSGPSSSATNYQEITLSIPELDGPTFIEHRHWKVPNVIASMRFTTRRYQQDKKLLFIEELQSDLHNLGSRIGYNVPMDRRKDKTMSSKDKLETVFANQPWQEKRPLDAPYKGFDWVSLALKKIIRHAVETGHDGISFASADQVVTMFDPMKGVETLNYFKLGDKQWQIVKEMYNGSQHTDTVNDNQLEDYVGRAVARRIRALKGGRSEKEIYYLEGNLLKPDRALKDKIYGTEIESRLNKLLKIKPKTINITNEGKNKYYSFNNKIKEKYILAQRSFQLEEAKSNLEIPKETTLQYVQRGVQDKLNRLDQIQKKIGVDQDELDAYMKADLFTSKATARIDKVNDWLVDGKDSFLVRMQEEGFTLDDLAEYMYAKHAKERNKHIKDTINPENKFGSGMTNKEANEILKSYDKKIEKFTKEFRAEVIDKRLDVLRDSGLIDEDAYNLFTSGEIFKNYVPLKGNASGQSIPMTGKGYNVTGKDIKRIKRGRSSRAENPVIQSIVDLNESIIRAEKNTIGKSLIKLIQENKDVVLDNGEKLWEAKGLKYLPRYDSNGEVEFMDPSRLQQNQLMYWDDGKAKVVTINDPALYEGLANVGMGRGVPILNQLNNYLRLINTSLNPEFMITNFQRDVQTATLQLSTNQSNKIAKKTAMTLPKAMKGIFDYLVLKKESKWSKAYEDFIDQGGKIGWIDQGTVEQKEKDLKKKLDRYTNTNNLKLGIQSVANFIDDINTVVESGTRLSAYQNLIESGVSKEKASQIAKNMTVNFNKKGQWGSALNTFYLFFNASVQGGFNILKTLTSKKGQSIAGGLAVAGFVNSYINRAMDEDEWDEVNDYDKDTKWLFKYPGMKGYIPIMLPYGYNVFVATGRIVEEMTFGEMLPYQAYSRMLNAVDNAFNPIGGGTIFQMLSPTALDLPTQILEGKNWTGQPYKPEQAPYGRKKPQSELYYDSARKTSIDIAKKLNELTGGNARVQGKISFSPEDIDLVTDFATGGTGRFLANSFETGKMLIQDKELPDIKNIPIARKFYVKKSEFKSKSIAYDLLERSETKKLTNYEIGVFKRRVKMANDAGALSDEQSEKMLEDLEKNIKYLNAPQKEIDTVQKIDKMYKQLKRNKLSKKEMNELYDLVDDAEFDEYITKQKMRRIQKMIQEKEK